MSSTPGTPLRAVRAALFAAVCVLLAGAGHASASGHGIPATALGAAFAGTGVLGWLGGRRQRGPLGIGGGLLAVQGALHLLFGQLSSGMHAGGHTGHGGASGIQGGMSGMRHSATGGTGGMHGMHAQAGDSAQPAAGAMESLHGSPAMLAAHLGAALVCALWLWRGEAALFALLRTMAALAVPPLALRAALGPCGGRPDLPSVRPRPRDRTRRRPVSALLLDHTVVRRGPPPGRAPSTTMPAPVTV